MFKGIATGGAVASAPETTEIGRALATLYHPTDHVELRVLPGGRSIVRRADDLIDLIGFVSRQDDYSGVYYTLNPVRWDLDGSAKNGDIVRRQWLLVDVDAVREPDTNATEREHEAARELAQRIIGELMGQGWPLPLEIDSGNGWHLLYRIDLPNDDLSKTLCRDALKALATRFDTDTAKVDKSVHNASRIAKLPGTWARKAADTPDRPQRLCRIVNDVGGKIAVTAEQLQKLGAVKASPPPPPTPGLTEPPTPFRGRVTNDATKISRARAYLKKIPGAISGQHGHTATFVAALKVVRGFDLTNEEAKTVLSEWNQTCQPPWSDKDLERKISEAQNAEGTRGNLFNAERNGKHEAPQRPPIDPNVPLTVKMSRVTPLVVEWLMPNRIPKRFITVMAGQTGIGKSFVSCDLIARISRGGEIPFSGGKTFPVGGTLIISEDSHEYVLAPRLIDAGADMNRIHAMTWAAMGQYHLSDIEMLERAANEVDGGVSVIMIDPPTNFLEGTDEHKNSEVRQLVMKIVEWALTRDVAVLFILHVNKNAKGVDALNRVMGSVAWVTTARIAHSFCPDPDDRDRGLWAPLKSNLGPMGKAIAYKIVKKEGVTVVEWCEEVDITANAAMNQEKSNKPRKVQASVFLEELFSEQIEIPSNEIWKAKELTNVSKNALLEAKDAMGIIAQLTHDTDGTQRWVWRWPAESRTQWMLKKQGSDAKAAERAMDRESGARF